MSSGLINEFSRLGYHIIPSVYNNQEIQNILTIIEKADKTNANFRKSDDLFAVRQFLKEIPELSKCIFNAKLKEIIHSMGENYFVVKSIYFDKPAASNWFVAWHQDMTISVDKKIDIAGYGPWTVKQNQFAVQPPVSILENIFTIRIHLDDTDENNGALKVIPGSHKNGIVRVDNPGANAKEITCNVPAGGIMLMKPLLFHRSSRTTNNKQRRVIHIELSNVDLSPGLKWSERI